MLSKRYSDISRMSVERFFKRVALFLFFIYFALRYTKNKREALASLILGKPVSILMSNGVRVSFSKNNTRSSLILYEVFIKKVYNPKFMPIDKNDIVVDIGANIGAYSLYAAPKTRETVYACEPFSENVKLLRQNVRDNKIRNIVIKKVAISSKSAPVRLFISGIGEGHSLYPNSEKEKRVKFVKVKSITLSELIDTYKLREIGFLKMDCEGSEGEILASTPIEDLRKIKKIAIEFHDDSSRLKHTEINRMLMKAGFKVIEEWDGKSPYGYIYAFGR